MEDYGGRKHLIRFHPCHGENIALKDNNTVAYRKAGFGNALAFSEKPIMPGEVFLVEIEANYTGWTGYLRVGFTQMDPKMMTVEGYRPQYSLPDLPNKAPSWIYAVTRTNIYLEEGFPRWQSNESKFYLGDDNHVHTIRGKIPRSILRPVNPISNAYEDSHSPVDVGSRVGLLYLPKRGPNRSGVAQMHIILNGEDHGPCSKGIPYQEGPVYAVVDIYGTTKQVRIIQLYGVPTLKSACRDVILGCMPDASKSAIFCLPLPKPLKEYLLFQE